MSFPSDPAVVEWSSIEKVAWSGFSLGMDACPESIARASPELQGTYGLDHEPAKDGRLVDLVQSTQHTERPFMVVCPPCLADEEVDSCESGQRKGVPVVKHVLKDCEGAVQLASLSARYNQRIERVGRRLQAQDFHLVIQLCT